MLIVNRIGEDAGRYYRNGPAGQWCGAGRHELGLDGPVTAGALAAVLAGRRPDDEAPLAARRAPHRRAGWDLILAAPKSVSLVAALGPPETGEALTAAHRRACADAFGWLERHGCWARRDGGLVPTSGFVAVRFGHEVNAAGEPHLHSHVLIANIVRAGDGGWSAVDGSGVWLNRRAVAGIYHLALRQQVLAAGLRPDWAVRPDGTADMAEVPRRAIEATSTRRRQIRGRLAGQDDPPPLTRSAARHLSRRQPVAAQPWADRAAAVGFGPGEVGHLLDLAGRQAHVPVSQPGGVGAEAGRRLSAEVVVWLAERRSTFSVVDVIQALSAVHSEGAAAADADRWARAFTAASPLADDGRRTSALAVARDEAFVQAAMTRAGSGLAVVDGMAMVDGMARVEGMAMAEGLAPAVHRLTTAGAGVEILAAPRSSVTVDGWRVMTRKGGFVAQAEVLDAARVLWQQAGWTVAVSASTDGAARRWRALAGLDRHRAGMAPPAVLVVDRADRHTTGELTGLLDEATRHGTKLVLVEGGTRPARRVPLSQGLGWLTGRQGPIVANPVAGAPGPPGTSDGRNSLDEAMAGRLAPELMTLDTTRVTAFASGRQALEQVVATWAGRQAEGRPLRMVALGPPECDELNRRARAVLRATGALTGAEVVIGGRPFAVGDSVVALRRGGLAGGEFATVREVVAPGSMLLQSTDLTRRIAAWNGQHLRHAYALTPGMLRFDDRDVVSLGHPADLGRQEGRVVSAAVIAPDTSRARTSLLRGSESSRHADRRSQVGPDLGW